MISSATPSLITDQDPGATSAQQVSGTIHYRHIHKFFSRRHLLDDLSLSLHGGQVALLCGENGSGKTTLLRILCGMDKPAQCLVLFGTAENPAKWLPWSQCRKQLQQQVMYLHQQPYMFDGTVVRNLALALPRRMPTAQRNHQLRAALEWAQLDKLADCRAKTLSSGEKQRVALSRAWLRQSRILLLDEPIANMDQESRARTIALLKQLKQQHTALLIASHTHEVFDEIADCRMILNQGNLAQGSPAHELSGICQRDNTDRKSDNQNG